MARRARGIFLWHVWVYLLAQSVSLQGHGFTAETPLHTSEGYYCLEALAELLLEAKTVYDVDSGPVHTGSNEAVPITHIARGTSNCYVRVAVGPQHTDVLCCSPQQKFYVPAENAWKEASALVVGAELLTKFGHRKQIHSIDLIRQPTELYAIAVPEPHIFCIGNHGIVTHNMIIPGVMLSVSVPWGFEAGLPMVAGFLGPATFGISLAVGGIAALVYTCCAKRSEVHQYKLAFDTATLTACFNNKQVNKQQPQMNSGGSSGEPDDPKDPKKRRTDKVGNMYQLFALKGFGQKLKECCRATKHLYERHAKIFEVTRSIPEYGIKEGELFYLDTLHYDHIEVFASRGQRCVNVLNLDGSHNAAKFLDAIKDKRTITEFLR